MALDANGTLWGENSPGVLSQIATGMAPNSAANSTSLFGREYLTLHDGQFGIDVPRQYDGANFDRVSQVGPGAGVAAVVDIVANISSIARASNTVTVATSTPHGIVPGDSVTIAGVTDTSYNGVFLVATIPDSLHFTYAQTAANSSSSGGTAAPVGSIAAGVHQCTVIFVTRQGYLTPPSAPVSWTANGVPPARFTRSCPPPLLSTNLASRLSFARAGGASFFYTTGYSGAPQLQMFDNSATSLVVDFSDIALLAGIFAHPPL